MAVGLVLVGSLTAGASGELLTILVCALVISAMGFLDDWRTLGPSVKLIVELSASVALWAVGVRAGLAHRTVRSALWAITSP